MTYAVDGVLDLSRNIRSMSCERTYKANVLDAEDDSGENVCSYVRTNDSYAHSRHASVRAHENPHVNIYSALRESCAA